MQNPLQPKNIKNFNEMHLSEICNIKKNKNKIKNVPAVGGREFS